MEAPRGSTLAAHVASSDGWIGAIVNPDKLGHLGPVADVGSLLRSAR